ncbi:MAG: DUF4198 domain-containing protein, partial [Deltaproteobacteria bacterium]|nr:DUF4198 domain-containing protein [Deltaproteobacteria bacterium]
MKFKIFTLALFILALAAPVMAHDFWAGSQPPAADGKVTVFVGYGHAFPATEEIGPQDADRFGLPTMQGVGGPVALVAGTSPFSLVTDKAPAKGTYLVTVETKAGFSGPTPNGWVRKSKKEEPSMTRCSYGNNFGKAIINIGGAQDKDLIAKPVGQKIEIVPQVNPATVKVGQPFPVVVYYDGKPLPRAQVGAFFAGFTKDNSAYAFQASTNREGEVNIIPLVAGEWLAKVNYTNAYSDL